MSKFDQAAALKVLRAARIHLLTKHMFFGDLAFGMPFEFNEELNPPTAATDGERIIFHPGYLGSLKPQEVVFLMAHEVLHPALMHCTRRGTRDPKLWNVACDVVANELLVNSKVGVMPQGGIYRHDLYVAGQGKVEKIYALIAQEDQDAKDNGDPSPFGEAGDIEGGGSMDQCLDTAEARKDAVNAQWRTKLAQAVQTARMAGQCPGGIEEFVNELINPKVHWLTLLRQFLVTAKGADRTWSRPNRRYQASGIYLPGATGVKSERLVIAVDCSGSVSQSMISQASAEIRSIHGELRPDELHILYFDTKVQRAEMYEPEEDFEIKAYGRGGTAFSPVFKHIAEHGICPETCVVLTDLECNDFGPAPEYPVLWVSDRKGKAPWGQVVIAE